MKHNENVVTLEIDGWTINLITREGSSQESFNRFIQRAVHKVLAAKAEGKKKDVREGGAE